MRINFFILLFLSCIFNGALQAMEQNLLQLTDTLKELSGQLKGTMGVPKGPIESLGVPAKHLGPLVREDFVGDIVGYTRMVGLSPETQFRNDLAWTPQTDLVQSGELLWNEMNGVLENWNEANEKSWVGNSRRAAIFQGPFRALLSKELDALLPSSPVGGGKFIIRIFDPQQAYLSDIRYLQAQHENKFANFQLASTFWGPLEGGMVFSANNLEDMLYSPVQGEEASISCAGATIWRKYFMPTYLIKKQQSTTGYYYLLEWLTDELKRVMNKSVLVSGVLDWEKTPHAVTVNAATIPSYLKTFLSDPNNKDRLRREMQIGIHSDVVVTSGVFAGEDNNGSLSPKTKTKKSYVTLKDIQTRLDVAVAQDGTVDTSKTQLVTQLFTAAYDISKNRNNPNAMTFAQMILDFAYETTFKGAAYNARNSSSHPNRKKLYLTMLGGGSFMNDLDWIGNAIESNIALINKYGLDVVLIYRPDYPRRSDPVKESNFIKKMLECMNKVNIKKIQPSEINSMQDKFKENYFNTGVIPNNKNQMHNSADAMNTELLKMIQ